jgi:hypothetical protein
MTNLLKNYALSILGILLLASFNQDRAQETGSKEQPSDQIIYRTMEGLQWRILLDKAATDSKEFSDNEVRELFYRDCLARDPDDDWRVARKKLIDLGEAIFPFLCKEALKPHEEKWGEFSAGRIAVAAVDYFDRSESSDKTEIRKVSLNVFEKFPKQYLICCRVIGKIGQPEDVTKLLSFMNAKDAYVFSSVLEAIGKIAAVSQIPEIEKAIAEWDKKHPTDNEDWANRRRAEIDKHLANIRERNVQWTPPPPPKAEEPKAEGKEPAPEAEKNL